MTAWSRTHSRVFWLGLTPLSCHAARQPPTPADPAALTVAITPSSPLAGYEDLVCSVQNATSAATLSWSVDGQSVGSGDRVSAEQTRRSGTWRCTATTDEATAFAEVISRPPGGNILVLVADDLGRERLSSEALTAGPFSQTPELDALAARSTRFVNAWSMPTCSPTRAALFTGRMPRQHGIGTVIYTNDRYALPDTEAFLPQVLAAADEPVQSVLVGKWHLNGRDVGSAELQPGVAGFDSWRATNGNLEAHFGPAPGRNGYGNWEQNTDGELAVRTDYATGVLVADAIAQLDTLQPPWLLYVGLHAMHEPWHVPPPEWRYTEPLSADPPIQEQSDLMLESLDIAVGLILAAMTDEQLATTTVVFVGDNGSMFTVPRPPYDDEHAKGTVYQGGVNVPLWVSGPLVSGAGRAATGLVTVADLFDTMLAIAGIPADEADVRVGRSPTVRNSVSLLPYLSSPDRPSLTEFSFTESHKPNGPPPWHDHHIAVRDAQHKLIMNENEHQLTFELYDLALDPFESVNLLSQELSPTDVLANERLMAALQVYEAELTFDTP